MQPRTVRVIGWMGLFGCAALMVAGPVAAQIAEAKHQRDEAVYLKHVKRSGTADFTGTDLALMPSDDVLVAAGDRACDWLSRRPPALLLTSDGRRQLGLQRDYRAHLPAADRAMPEGIIGEAWSHLCPGTMYVVKPHFVFRHIWFTD